MQKSRQVSLTPTRLDLNRHPFVLVTIEIVKNPLILNNTYSTHWHGSYSSSTDVKYFQFSFIAHYRQHIFSLWRFLMYCGQHKKRVQLEHTASGCREHRKQMPFLSTGADTERLSPHGVLLTEVLYFLYPSTLLNTAPGFWTGGEKTLKKSHKRMQRRVW